MKSKTEIEMDFFRAVTQAEELEKVSERLSDIACNNTEALNTLKAEWHGINAEKFIKKGSKLEAEMLGTADDLLKIAKNIRNTAGLVYNAEKIAVQLGL